MTVMMSSQLSIRGSIVFLLIFPLVSSQCSTCLDGKCHIDGECMTGCVPGYVDRYCDVKCPANCINSVCHISHSGTDTCSDGCKPGYCGAKCSVSCPSGCETCGRSCDNCNMTLCPQGQYGENCESTCDLKFEKCDSESGNCVKCRPGYYGDDCGKTCPSPCLSPDKVLLSRCVSQCQSCSSEDFCPPGVYGMSCDMNCSRNCGRPDSSEQRPCNKATGECSAGCQSGYYGRTCNYTCSELCLSDTCYQHNGTCEYGCIAGYTISNGICTTISDRVPRDKVIAGVICGLLILIIIVIIVIICCKRRKIKRSMTPKDQEEMVPLNDSALEQSIIECRKLQEKAAKELKEVADRLREQQKDMNKAKIAFSCGELAAGGVAAAGVLLAPFTAGLSFVLTGVGVGVGIAAASGNVASVVAEFKMTFSRTCPNTSTSPTTWTVVSPTSPLAIARLSSVTYGEYQLQSQRASPWERLYPANARQDARLSPGEWLSSSHVVQRRDVAASLVSADVDVNVHPEHPTGLHSVEIWCNTGSNQDIDVGIVQKVRCCRLSLNLVFVCG